MKVSDIKKKFHKQLSAFYVSEEITSFFYILLQEYYGVSRLELAMDVTMEVANTIPILEALELLEQQTPIQYILGEADFYDLKFKVNNSVLIPRPETEALVRWVLNSVPEHTEINILDIGTGSGCIAVSLSKNLPKANVYAIDISEKALIVAKENAKLNDVEVTFVKADVLSLTKLKFQKEIEFDIIVSNPPYVRTLEKKLMQTNVLDYEPELALFVTDNNPLLFYNAISKLAKQHLKTKGMLFFEINEYLGQETNDLLKDFGFKNIELKKDIFKKDRMLKAENI